MAEQIPNPFSASDSIFTNHTLAPSIIPDGIDQISIYNSQQHQKRKKDKHFMNELVKKYKLKTQNHSVNFNQNVANELEQIYVNYKNKEKVDWAFDDLVEDLVEDLIRVKRLLMREKLAVLKLRFLNALPAKMTSFQLYDACCGKNEIERKCCSNKFRK